VDSISEQIAANRAAGRDLTERVRTLAESGDTAGLRDLAEKVWRDHPAWCEYNELDRIYDRAFPVRGPGDLADILDTPWPTVRRTMQLLVLSAPHGCQRASRAPFVAEAVAAGDAALLRLLIVSPVGELPTEAAVRALDGLYALGVLDATVVEHALLADEDLGYAVLGRAPRGADPSASAAACADLVQGIIDELLWRLTGPGGLTAASRLPEALKPRGLRFVLRALAWPKAHPLAGRLGAAALTEAERAELSGYLRGRPKTEQLRAFRLRLPAGDADALLPALGLADAGPLLVLLKDLDSEERSLMGHRPVRRDRTVILTAVAQAGSDGARRLLTVLPSEVVAAALGWNRPEVLKRVKHGALQGIAAYGLLPLAEGETVLDRYLALREIAKQGAKFGPERRLSHAAAVEIALDHLAQVAGYPDAERLEWDCEARIAAEPPPVVRAGGYTAELRMDGAEPAITVIKEGKLLKSVPAAVRANPGYAGLREHQERLRGQARRMRTGLIEKLVAAGGTLQPRDLARLMDLPAGTALLPALLWQDRQGAIGLLGQVDVSGPVTAVHPVTLYERGLLAQWQREIVSRRIRQPVKQAFRELYLLTPAEREAGDVSRRFAGHVVDGKVAAQLLSGRGWSMHDEYAAYQAERPAGPELVAVLTCDFHGYFGLGEVITGEVRFLAGRAPVPLDRVPSAVFSEVMRDLDMVVSVAGTGEWRDGSATMAQSRAQLLAALIADLGLDRVTVDGTCAVVRGTRATYRVHLTSGSIHVEPGGYLCVVPTSFGGSAHGRLFLPFADEDRMTSVILSKVLLLNDDEHITDPTILAQLPRYQPVEPGALAPAQRLHPLWK